MQLRKYQQSFTLQHRKDLAKYKHVIAQSPTGSGKTKMFIYLAKKAIEAGKTVLMIVEGKRLYKQLQDEYPSIEINASNRFVLVQRNKHHIAMAQTLKKRPSTISMFNSLGDNLYIITDEAHVGQATVILEKLTIAFLSGFTATPDYRCAKHLPKIYKHLTPGPQVKELIYTDDPDGPFLMPCKHYARQCADHSGLKIKNGNFTEESQLKVYDVRNVYDILEEDLRFFNFKKCMIFTSSIEHAVHCKNELESRGFRTAIVHSELSPEENECNFLFFTKGGVNICINVAMLTKGIDHPPIDGVVTLRDTTSLGLYLQMLGRGSRPFIGKLFFTHLDYGTNCERHGFYDDDRDWSELWKQKPKKQGVTPTKLCPKCEYICHAAAPSCPDCGYIFPVKEKEQEAAKTELVELTPQHKSWATMTAIELYQASKERNYKRAIQEARKRESTHPGFLGEFANAAGYKLSWVQDQLRFI